MSRRDSNDKQWQEVKKQVHLRDKDVCRLMKVLTLVEFATLTKNAHQLVNILDPAHYLAVSYAPSEVYNVNNICLLNRYSHEHIDNCRSPINGKPITVEERQVWWTRILEGNKKQFKALKDSGLIQDN